METGKAPSQTLRLALFAFLMSLATYGCSGSQEAPRTKPALTPSAQDVLKKDPSLKSPLSLEDLKKTAEAGKASAMAGLGDHCFGVGEALKDYAKAKSWYHKAARRGEDTAMLT